jgi:CDP-glucose 4,6-dehydratase
VERLLARHWVADIRDESTLASALEEAEPEIVLHLAAQSVVRRSYQIPRETFDVNVMGTVSVLECIRRRGKPCVVVAVTSDKCYENREQVWGYRESDALGERDPYGASKGAAELAIRAYRESFFPPAHHDQHRVKLASARAGNVIGGGDFTPDALVVDVAKAVSQRQAASIRNPGAFRPWQHVLEALSGYLTLAGRLWESDDPEYCSGWNFGPLPGSEIPVRNVVELFLREFGGGDWIDASDPRQPHESTTLRLAIDKAIWRLGWKPRWNVERAIAETARWYRAYFEGTHDIAALLNSQIASYEQTRLATMPELSAR